MLVVCGQSTRHTNPGHLGPPGPLLVQELSHEGEPPMGTGQLHKIGPLPQVQVASGEWQWLQRLGCRRLRAL